MTIYLVWPSLPRKPKNKKRDRILLKLQEDKRKSTMSGGVGPTYNDITLPKEQEDEEEHEQEQKQFQHPTGKQQPLNNQTHRRPAGGGGGGGFLSFQQLNSLAVLVVFSASGLVSLDDVGFVLLSFFYISFLSKIVFPPKNENDTVSLTSPKYVRLLKLYVSAAGVVGLLFPICYIFHGMFDGDQNGMKAAAPHVFLLASQVFMEGMASSRGFSAPMRILVPVFYNARRILTLSDWLRNEFSKEESEIGSITHKRLIVGKVLAVVNMGLWCFNLLAVLLPVYLPRAFQRYYGGNTKQI